MARSKTSKILPLAAGAALVAAAVTQRDRLMALGGRGSASDRDGYGYGYDATEPPAAPYEPSATAPVSVPPVVAEAPATEPDGSAESAEALATVAAPVDLPSSESSVEAADEGGDGQVVAKPEEQAAQDKK